MRHPANFKIFFDWRITWEKLRKNGKMYDTKVFGK